jgi:hypothetical protein
MDAAQSLALKCFDDEGKPLNNIAPTFRVGISDAGRNVLNMREPGVAQDSFEKRSVEKKLMIGPGLQLLGRCDPSVTVHSEKRADEPPLLTGPRSQIGAH